MTKLNEIFEITKAWLVISLAFSILLGLNIYTFLVSLFTVGLGFIFHELMHKYFAIKYKCKARFKAFDSFLLLSLIFAFLGFIIVIPGAVFIQGKINKVKEGKISLAGPSANIILALIFYILFMVFNFNFLRFGFYINAWLGFFNLLPFFGLDGSKILKWNKFIYSIALFIAAITVFFNYV